MKKKKPKGYSAGGVTKQQLAEMKALAKKSGKSGLDQPVVEAKMRLKGKKRNVSPEEIRARKEEKKMGGGGMPASKLMPKRMAPGGKAKSGKLPMVEKDGKMVPFFAADGVGKMQEGGPTPPKTKGYFKGGRTMSGGGKPATKTKAKGGAQVRGSGAARKQKFSKNG